MINKCIFFFRDLTIFIAFEIIDLMLFSLNSGSVSVFFKFFTILKNNVTNLLPNIKNKVINIVVNLTRLATADVNDIIVTVILVTEKKNKHVLRNS